jgi:hypothetical protein
VLAEVQGSTRDGLVALRDLLARSLESAETKEVAALAGRLESVLLRLEAMPVAKGLSPLDEIAAKRSKRRPAAGAGVPVKGRVGGKRSG